MSSDALVDRLVGDLRPVARPNVRRSIAILLTLAAIELAGFLAIGMMRPDMGAAVARPAFWWKIGGLAALALLGVGIALRSFDPVSSPRQGIRRWGVVLAGLLVVGAGIDSAGQGLADLPGRLMWHTGVMCLMVMTLLALPPVIALGLMMRRGAPTDRPASAVAVGLAAAAWGAFIFAFNCPSDDPFYIVSWYALGCGAVTVLARPILPVAARW